MKIKIKNKRQGVIYTVKIENPQYSWQVRDAISKAMELDGYDQYLIDEVFNRQRDSVKQAVKEEE